MSDINQIRINELARELEIKAKVLIEYLPEIGVTEKKTHSSSIDIEHAVLVRKHFQQLAEQEAAAEAAKSAPKAEARNASGCASASHGCKTRHARACGADRAASCRTETRTAAGRSSAFCARGRSADRHTPCSASGIASCASASSWSRSCSGRNRSLLVLLQLRRCRRARRNARCAEACGCSAGFKAAVAAASRFRCGSGPTDCCEAVVWRSRQAGRNIRRVPVSRLPDNRVPARPTACVPLLRLVKFGPAQHSVRRSALEISAATRKHAPGAGSYRRPKARSNRRSRNSQS